MSDLFSTTRGIQWSFSVEVQGYPWVYTDGVASWSGVWADPYIEMASCLATREFELKWLSNPQEPLTTGSGMSFELRDDGTDTVFRTWSKDYRGRSGYGRLSQSMTAAATDTTLYIAPATATELLPDDAFIFVGPETMRITDDSIAGQRGVARAQFSTLRHEHRVFDTVRPAYTTSPTSFKDRVITLWAAPVDPLTGLLDAAEAIPIWAGLIEDARIVDEKVKIEAEPLASAFKRSWPAVLPSATLLPRLTSSWAPSTNHQYIYTIVVRFGSTGEDFYLRLGEYDDSGTFAVKPIVLPAEYTLTEYVKWVQDTIVEFMDNDPRSPYAGAPSTFRASSQFGLSVVAVTEGNRRGDFDIMAMSLLSVPIWIRGRGLPNRHWSVVRANTNGLQRLTSVRDRVSYMTAEQTEIRVRMDRPAHPFQTTWSWDGTDESEVGYVIIGDKEDFELVRFSGVTVDADDPALVTLTGCARGYAGTEAKAWGKPEDDESSEDSSQQDIKDRSSAVTLVQPLMIAEPTGQQSGGNVADLVVSSKVPLYILLSTEDRGQNGDYDRLDGYRQGLALPERWVDVAAFESLARVHNLPLLAAFWTNEQGKGKEGLEELLKLAGIYLVERRFTDKDGFLRYGLSVESIDLPASSYGLSLTDDHQVSGSRGTTTHNERLVVNSTKLKPFISWGAKDAKGEEIFHWDEWSIAEYGPSKQLEFKPTAMMGVFDNRTGGEAYRDREGQAAWLFEVSNRWFAAFGRGSYGGEIEVAAPLVYRYQIGDLIYLSLPTLRDSEGSPGLVGIGHVIKVEHRWGTRGTGRVAWRSGIENFCELAPVARATITSPTTMSVMDNIYSYTADRSPFGTGWAAKDIQWFDTAQHGGNIECKGWVVGNYAATINNFTITSTNLNTGVLTCSANLETLFGAGTTIIFTFAEWLNTTTALSRQYAYVADNSGLESGVPAKEYS